MNFERVEDELQVLLSTPSITPSKQARIEQLLAEPIRWNDLFENARNQGTFPLVFQNLRHFAPASVDDTVLQRWQQIYFAVIARNMALAAELVSLLTRFREANIPAIPLKGPVLAQLIYGDIGLRMFDDLDILVPQEQIEQAKDILLKHGYQYAKQQLFRIEQDTQQDSNHYTLSKQSGFTVELHWTLEPPLFSSHENAARFWENTKEVPCLGIPVIIPKDEELLLFLCRHGSRHLWESLKWLGDLARFVQTCPDLDWQYMLMRMAQTRTKRAILWGLYLADQTFDLPLPEPIRQQIAADKQIQRLQPWTFAAITSQTTSTTDEELYALRQIELIRLQDDGLSKLTYINMLLGEKTRPNQIDRSMIHLPASLSILYYFLHFFRLLGKYSNVWIRRIRAP